MVRLLLKRLLEAKTRMVRSQGEHCCCSENIVFVLRGTILQLRGVECE